MPSIDPHASTDELLRVFLYESRAALTTITDRYEFATIDCLEGYPPPDFDGYFSDDDFDGFLTLLYSYRVDDGVLNKLPIFDLKSCEIWVWRMRILLERNSISSEVSLVDAVEAGLSFNVATPLLAMKITKLGFGSKSNVHPPRVLVCSRCNSVGHSVHRCTNPGGSEQEIHWESIPDIRICKIGTDGYKLKRLLRSICIERGLYHEESMEWMANVSNRMRAEGVRTFDDAKRLLYRDNRPGWGDGPSWEKRNLLPPDTLAPPVHKFPFSKKVGAFNSEMFGYACNHSDLAGDITIEEATWNQFYPDDDSTRVFESNYQLASTMSTTVFARKLYESGVLNQYCHDPIWSMGEERDAVHKKLGIIVEDYSTLLFELKEFSRIPFNDVNFGPVPPKKEDFLGMFPTNIQDIVGDDYWLECNELLAGKSRTTHSYLFPLTPLTFKLNHRLVSCVYNDGSFVCGKIMLIDQKVEKNGNDMITLQVVEMGERRRVGNTTAEFPMVNGSPAWVEYAQKLSTQIDEISARIVALYETLQTDI